MRYVFLSLALKKMHTLTGSRSLTTGSSGAHATFVHRGPHNEHNWKFLVAALCIEDSLDSSNFVSCPMTNKRPSLAKNHKLMIYYGF